MMSLFVFAASGQTINQSGSAGTTYYGNDAGQGSSNPLRGINYAIVSNDANNLYFTIAVEPVGSLATNGSFNYIIGITPGTNGAGGDTSLSSDHGNPYGRTISFSTAFGGMTDFIGGFGAGGSGSPSSPFTSFGFYDYVYGTPGAIGVTNGGWTEVREVSSGQPISMQPSTLQSNVFTLTVPMSDFAANLPLTTGSTFDFDIDCTGLSGDQTAYDSLALGGYGSVVQTGTYSSTYQFNETVLDQYTVAAPAHYPSPADWRNENIYQILTDRFYDGNPSNDNAEASHGSPYDPLADDGINGGDFLGIQMKLGYIKSLGATAIWISPIPLNVGGNSAYHGYHAQDFYTLAPHWGTMTDLTNLVEAAHALGIKVILDIVVNHTGELLTSTNANWPNYIAPPGGYVLQYYDPLNQEAFPFNPTNVVPPLITTLFHTNGYIQNYNYPSATQEVVLGELDGLDDLRTETTYVRTNMMNIYTNWVGLGDFDGFRVDTAIEVDYGCWQYWCPQLHQFGASIGKSNFFMFGEAFSSNEQEIGSYTGSEIGGPYMFDSMLDYGLFENCIHSVFATATGNPGQIISHYNDVSTYYATNSWYDLVTFLDNHDNARFLSSGNANGNTNNLTVALQFLYTSRGVPCLYYGTEQAFAGDNNDNDNREDMFAGGWQPQIPITGDNFDETQPLFQQIARLNNFRRLYPAICTGYQNNLYYNTTGPGLFAYSRVLSNQEVFVCLNTATASQLLTNCPTTYSPGTVLANLLNTNDTIVVTSGHGTNLTPTITVPAMTAKIYIGQSQMLPLNPVVVSQYPTHASTNVATLTPIVLKFSKPMNTNSVQASFTVKPASCTCISYGSLTVCSAAATSGAPAATGTFAWDTLDETMTFTPSTAWAGLTTNLVDLSTNAMDGADSNAFYGPFDTFFVTSTNFLGAPANLSATTAGTNQINLVWNASPGSSGYVVNRNGAQIATTSVTNYTDANLAVATTYCYTVVATNNSYAVGSADSLTACAMTLAITASTNLLAYWSFDEGAGSFAYDYSGNGNTGTVVLGIGSWTNGMVNGALFFSGENANGLAQETQVTVSNSATLNPLNGITLAAWVNDQSGGWYNTPRIIEKGVSDNQYGLYASGGTQLVFFVAGISNGTITVTPPTTRSWHHLAATYDGSSVMNFYIDGQLSTQQLASGAMPVVTDPLAIGNKPAGTSLLDFFTGDIDDVRIYGSALSPSQISALYNIDSLSDGIPNWWRLQYFGSSSTTNSTSCATCDADGTGQDNYFKWIADLNPTDSSFFRVQIAAVASNQTINLTFWPAYPNSNLTYTAQSSADLVNYSNLTNSISQASGVTDTVTDLSPWPTNEFYRIQITNPGPPP